MNDIIFPVEELQTALEDYVRQPLNERKLLHARAMMEETLKNLNREVKQRGLLTAVQRQSKTDRRRAYPDAEKRSGDSR